MPLTIGELKKYKDNLYAAKSRDLADFEKNFLLISAGILAFTITFIKDVICTTDVDRLQFLFAGWILLGLSVAMIIVSFLMSAHSSESIWHFVDGEVNGASLINKADTESVPDANATAIKSKVDKSVKNTRTLLKLMRRVAIGLFILGLSSVAIFVGTNFTPKNNSATSSIDSFNLKIDKKNKNITIDNLTINFDDSCIIVKRKTTP